jgi:hypothetical protein
MLPRTQASLTNAVIVAATATTFAAAYSLLDTDPQPLVRLYIQYGPPLSLISWTIADLRGTELASIYDWGLFQCVAWPVLIPWYLKRRYGKGAWSLIGIFVALLLAPRLGAALRHSP